MKHCLIALAVLLSAMETATAQEITWESLGPSGGDVQLSAAPDGRVLAQYTDAVYESVDAGITWSRLPGWPADGGQYSFFPDGIITTSRGTLSMDGGSTWQSMRQTEWPSSLAWADGSLYYGAYYVRYESHGNVWTYPGGLLRSADQGETWQQILPETTSVTSVVASDGRVFVRTDAGRIHCSADGISMSTYRDVSGSGRVLQVHPEGGVFGVRGEGGVFRIDERCDLETVWSTDRPVQDLTIVEAVTNAIRATGTHEVIWDARSVPNGVYLIRIETREWTRTSRVVVAK